MRFSGPESEDVNISLTPLVDVVFLLLIFFMVSTTFSTESQLRLRLPSSDRSSEPLTEKQQLLVELTELSSNSSVGETGRAALTAGAPGGDAAIGGVVRRIGDPPLTGPRLLTSMSVLREYGKTMRLGILRVESVRRGDHIVDSGFTSTSV